MTSAARPVFSEQVVSSPWWWEAAPRPELPEVSLPDAVDIAIIGSGYTGLSAAITLARAGRSVIVLEKGLPGEGASSRNGGMLGDVLKPGYSGLVTAYGERVANDLWHEARASLDHTKAFIRDEALDCDFRVSGRFTGAVRPAHYETLARDTERVAKIISLDAEMVPRAEQHREIATDAYHGGRLLRHHASLHPAKYHLALLRLAQSLGVGIAAHTPLLRLSREGSRHALRTPRGRILARDVVVATNGYTGAATPAIRRWVVPVHSNMFATEELPPGTVERLIPGLRMITDTRRIVSYYRPSPDFRRILYGGRAAEPEWNLAESTRLLYAALTDAFPALRGARVTHQWCGLVAMSFANPPQIGSLDGVHYALCYSGSGVAMATYCGHKVALKVLGDPDGATAFDPHRSPVPPFHQFKALALPLAVRATNLADRLGLLRAGAG